MKLFFFTFLFSNFFMLCAAQKDTTPLRLNVSNLQIATGKIMIAVFNPNQEFLGENAVATLMEPAVTQGTQTIVISNVAFGNYAISIFHDVNDNGVLDTNFLGIPNEPYGFSNNARGRFGPPSFEAASFDFNAHNQTFEVELK